ncbi:MAG: class I adenylate-forming enzyme family protein [Steroidobacteraceae bacterium]
MEHTEPKQATTAQPAATMYALLEQVSSQAPDACAVADHDQALSYRELQAQVDIYAKALLALGVKSGDRVAMLAPPSIDFWIVLHAATSVGAVWLGLNPRYRQRDFEQVLIDSEPTAVVSLSPFEERDYCSELRPLLPKGVPIVCHGDATAGSIPAGDFKARGREVSDAALAAARAAVRAEDPAIIVYTSGTTGNPKGAVLSHGAIVSCAVANAGWMGPEALARAVCAGPVNHVGMINNACMNVLAGGGTIIFHPRVDLHAMAELSRRWPPTYMVSSPTIFAMMLAIDPDLPAYLESVRLIVFGGAATPKSMLEQIARCSARLSSVYGLTESCGVVTRTDETRDLDILADTIGTPLPGVTIRIARADGSTCAAGEAGEIQINAPFVMSGYFRNPAATADAFTADRFLRTGDVGLLRVDGNLSIVGRLKEMFKSGGYNIYPAEIEQAICEHPSVALAAVIATPDPKFQEVGMAFVEPRLGASVTAEEVQEFLRARIANYKIPKRFVIATELPKLQNLKIDKAALRSVAVRPGWRDAS